MLLNDCNFVTIIRPRKIRYIYRIILGTKIIRLLLIFPEVPVFSRANRNILKNLESFKFQIIQFDIGMIQGCRCRFYYTVFLDFWFFSTFLYMIPDVKDINI